MSFYTVRVAVIQVIGRIWQPGFTCAQEIKVDRMDENVLLEYGDGKLTREGVQAWLDTHAGDFQSITDFRADIGTHDVIEWENEESECVYNDAMYPSEEG